MKTGITRRSALGVLAGLSLAGIVPLTPVLAEGDDPVAVVRAFLTALQNQPTGQTATQYLSSGLQAAVRGGTPVISIVGVQNLWTSFSLERGIVGTTYANINANLSYPSGPVQRKVQLIMESGEWRINAIAAGVAPSPGVTRTTVSATVTTASMAETSAVTTVASASIGQLPSTLPHTGGGAGGVLPLLPLLATLGMAGLVGAQRRRSR